MNTFPPHIEGQMQFDLATDMLVRYPIVESPEPSLGLPPFSGKGAHCPKCGGEHVRINYHAGLSTWLHCSRIWWDAPSEVKRHLRVMPEHLDRTCSDCNYDWTEDVARDEDDL